MTAPRLTPAQRTNFLPLTAWGYSWWRRRSLSLLSGQAFSPEREARLFLALCRPQAGESWLDAGTSTGFYAGVLAAQGCRVRAADLSAAMLRQARREQPSAQIVWEQVNLEAAGAGDSESYDGITVGATLNETAHPALFLAQLERRLRSGGQLWLMWAAPTGGALQGGLGRLGGLFFPDLTWVERHLPGCVLGDAFGVGGVQFARLVRR